MGQQQLLLLVLTVVIVGLAVVIGIEAFDENERKSRLDAMTNEAVRIAAEAQAWSLKSPVFDGPEAGEGFAELTFTRLGYVADDLGVYATQNGQYAFTDTGAGCARLIGVDAEYDMDSGDPGDLDLYVQAVITGPGPDDIQMSTDGTPISC
ncbi:hypothetical protein [Rubrivirga marina]|uniref:Type 4 fimbrial biogenesis protein PilX N-terminal domain-containing protein n=1 Tax=Rubrivirga marina TaxID=1196024 RepID=A0A271IVN5_9BACT|nr:hypothetical protein [Rubrivirga marina]PAP75187.1 hypothetical protein BSZ37_01375 [Rubrivirga marina]